MSRPAVPDVEGHVYVIEFSSGLVKVGMTASPKERMRQHESLARIHDVAIGQHWVSEPHAGARANEKRLIDFCRTSPGATNVGEFFKGVEFLRVRDFAESLSYERATQEEERRADRFSPAATRARQLDQFEAATEVRRLAVLNALLAAGVRPDLVSTRRWLNDPAVVGVLSRLWDGEQITSAEFQAAFFPDRPYRQETLFPAGGAVA